MKQKKQLYLIISLLLIYYIFYALGLYQKNEIKINEITILRPQWRHYSAAMVNDTVSYWNSFKGMVRPKYSFNLLDNESVLIHFDNLYLNEKIYLSFMKMKHYTYDSKDTSDFNECSLDYRSMTQVTGMLNNKDIAFALSSNNESYLKKILNSICK